ncbi:hypothetical protein [Leifsonia sp. Leaf264]|uniref:hypothetical protein n=1 Tax=Leifsonia sp. Leaf264 TaxID=1736314 RepID=UPI0006FF556C|nr:hypothetical protein [Leifsonia sp. Leaf264]KQO98613.1 hypothetical protein ASF30_11160 [Leifsonia sp. Leaf264]
MNNINRPKHTNPDGTFAYLDEGVLRNQDGRYANVQTSPEAGLNITMASDFDDISEGTEWMFDVEDDALHTIAVFRTDESATIYEETGGSELVATGHVRFDFYDAVPSGVTDSTAYLNDRTNVIDQWIRDAFDDARLESGGTGNWEEQDVIIELDTEDLGGTFPTTVDELVDGFHNNSKVDGMTRDNHETILTNLREFLAGRDRDGIPAGFIER